MFIDRSQWTPNELRQGDVLAGVPFPFASVLDHHFISEFGPNEHKDFPQLRAKPYEPPTSGSSPESILFTGLVPLKLSLCAVLTQCCELVPRERGRIAFVQTVSVCRLVPLNNTMKSSSEKLHSIRSNGDPTKPGTYKNFFYYGAGAELGPEELMADFSQTTCIRSKEFPAAMANKVLQLDDRTRMKFKIKLSVFYGSPTQEERQAGILDPWNPKPAQTRSEGLPDLPPAQPE